MSLVNLIDVQQFYKELPHQTVAVTYLGELLLKTPAKERLNLETATDWLKLSEQDLQWLQRQISRPTLAKFTSLWRSPQLIEPRFFSQRDNSILAHATCSSSAHAMLVDYYLRLRGGDGLSTDETYLKRVFSGKYGRFGRNPSIYWDVQQSVVNSFGLEYEWAWDSNSTKLYNRLGGGDIAVINIFHYGHNRATRRGGHVVVAVDYDLHRREFLIYDPWGSKPSNGYRQKKNGIYKMPLGEFNWRWQGCAGYVV